MGSEEISHKMVGDFWFERLSQWTDAFMSVRSSSEEQRFLDVIYPELLNDPIGQGKRVLEAAGVDVTSDVINDMGQWIEANKREDRAPHKYDMSDFGLTEDMIKEKFSLYRQNYLGEV
jgi:hypothetical protein